MVPQEPSQQIVGQRVRPGRWCGTPELDPVGIAAISRGQEGGAIAAPGADHLMNVLGREHPGRDASQCAMQAHLQLGLSLQPRARCLHPFRMHPWSRWTRVHSQGSALEPRFALWRMAPIPPGSIWMRGADSRLDPTPRHRLPGGPGQRPSAKTRLCSCRSPPWNADRPLKAPHPQGLSLRI